MPYCLVMRGGQTTEHPIPVPDKEGHARVQELAEFHVTERPAGSTLRASCDANINGAPIAAARFTGPRVSSVSTPFAFPTSQVRADGAEVVSRVSGSSRNVPVRGSCDFGADGPLAWLHGAHPGRVPSVSVTSG